MSPDATTTDIVWVPLPDPAAIPTFGLRREMMKAAARDGAYQLYRVEIRRGGVPAGATLYAMWLPGPAIGIFAGSDRALWIAADDKESALARYREQVP